MSIQIPLSLIFPSHRSFQHQDQLHTPFIATSHLPRIFLDSLMILFSSNSCVQFPISLKAISVILILCAADHFDVMFSSNSDTCYSIFFSDNREIFFFNS